MAIDNPLMRIAAEMGSNLYDGAATYTGATLATNIRSIYIREDQAAMITAYSLDVKGTTVAQTGALSLVGKDLLAGDFYTFPYPLVSIQISGGSFIGYQG